MQGIRSLLQLFFFTRLQLLMGGIYRLYILNAIIGISIYLFVVRTFWLALYGSQEEFAGVDIRSMISYAMLGMLVGPGDKIAQEIGWKVRTGDIVLDLTKPIDYQIYMFLRVVSAHLGGWIQCSAPSFLVAFGLGLQMPISFINALAFILSSILAIVILFNIEFIIGCLGILFLDISGFSDAKKLIITLLSGQIVPLWFFPEWSQKLVYYSPFYSLAGAPQSIYIGIYEGIELWNVILLQVIWVILGYFIARYTFYCVNRRIVIQGG